MRVCPTLKEEEVEEMVNTWRDEAGPGVDIHYIQKAPVIPAVRPTRHDPWFNAFLTAADEL